jgi:ribosome recycling factor
MSNNKQNHIVETNKMVSSVEWLEDKLNNVKPTEFCSIETIKEWVKQAKEMHKQEIENVFSDGWNDCEKSFKDEELENDEYCIGIK